MSLMASGVRADCDWKVGEAGDCGPGRIHGRTKPLEAWTALVSAKDMTRVQTQLSAYASKLLPWCQNARVFISQLSRFLASSYLNVQGSRRGRQAVPNVISNTTISKLINRDKGIAMDDSQTYQGVHLDEKAPFLSEETEPDHGPCKVHQRRQNMKNGLFIVAVLLVWWSFDVIPNLFRAHWHGRTITDGSESYQGNHMSFDTVRHHILNIKVRS